MIMCGWGETVSVYRGQSNLGYTVYVCVCNQNHTQSLSFLGGGGVRPKQKSKPDNTTTRADA